MAIRSKPTKCMYNLKNFKMKIIIVRSISSLHYFYINFLAIKPLL